MTTGWIVAIIVAVYLLCFATLLCTLERARRTDVSPYPPEAAETPDPVEQAYAEVGDTFGFERSRLLDEVGPAIVAGQDLDNSLLMSEVEAAIAAYRRGEDVFKNAPKEMAG